MAQAPSQFSIECMRLIDEIGQSPSLSERMRLLDQLTQKIRTNYLHPEKPAKGSADQ